MHNNVHMYSYIWWLTSKKHLEKCPHLLVYELSTLFFRRTKTVSDPGNDA